LGHARFDFSGCPVIATCINNISIFCVVHQAEPIMECQPITKQALSYYELLNLIKCIIV